MVLEVSHFPGLRPVGKCGEKMRFLHFTNNQPVNKQVALLTWVPVLTGSQDSSHAGAVGCVTAINALLFSCLVFSIMEMICVPCWAGDHV